jgi:hypothetical protein
MKKILATLLLVASCGADSPWTHPMPPWPVVAPDEDPRHCAHNYPIEEPPEFCESNHSGDCCSWEDVETDAGTCRFDYCSAYDDHECSWTLQYKECTEE